MNFSCDCNFSNYLVDDLEKNSLAPGLEQFALEEAADASL